MAQALLDLTVTATRSEVAVLTHLHGFLVSRGLDRFIRAHVITRLSGPLLLTVQQLVEPVLDA